MCVGEGQLPDYMLHYSDEDNIVPLDKRLRLFVIHCHITILLSSACVGRVNIVPPENGTHIPSWQNSLGVGAPFFTGWPDLSSPHGEFKSL